MPWEFRLSFSGELLFVESPLPESCVFLEERPNARKKAAKSWTLPQLTVEQGLISMDGTTGQLRGRQPGDVCHDNLRCSWTVIEEDRKEVGNRNGRQQFCRSKY